MIYIINGKKYTSAGANYQAKSCNNFSMMPQPEEPTDIKQVIAEVAAQNELSKQSNSNNND